MEQYEIYTLWTVSNVIFYLLVAACISIIITTAIDDVDNLNESLYRTILVITTDYIGHLFTLYFPLIYTVFHLILFSNFIGMVPYSTTSTVEIIITLSIALTLLIAVLIRGFLSNGVVMLAAFIPAGTP